MQGTQSGCPLPCWGFWPCEASPQCSLKYSVPSTSSMTHPLSRQGFLVDGHQSSTPEMACPKPHPGGGRSDYLPEVTAESKHSRRLPLQSSVFVELVPFRLPFESQMLPFSCHRYRLWQAKLGGL